MHDPCSASKVYDCNHVLLKCQALGHELCLHMADPLQAWEGYCCPSSSLCTRANGFYYQCLPKPGVNVAANAPSNAADAPRNAPKSAVNAPAPVAGNPPRDAVVAAPPQEPVAARMKGGKCWNGPSCYLDCFTPPSQSALRMCPQLPATAPWIMWQLKLVMMVHLKAYACSLLYATVPCIYSVLTYLHPAPFPAAAACCPQ